MILNMFVNRFSLRDSSRILRSLNVCDILFDYIYSHLIYIHHFSILHLDRRIFWNQFKVHLFHLLKQPCEPRWLPPPPKIEDGVVSKMRRLKKPDVVSWWCDCSRNRSKKESSKYFLNANTHTHNRFKTWIDVKDNDSYRYIYIYIYLYIHILYIYTELAFCIDYSRCTRLELQGFWTIAHASPRISVVTAGVLLKEPLFLESNKQLV